MADVIVFTDNAGGVVTVKTVPQPGFVAGKLRIPLVPAQSGEGITGTPVSGAGDLGGNLYRLVTISKAESGIVGSPYLNPGQKADAIATLNQAGPYGNVLFIPATPEQIAQAQEDKATTGPGLDANGRPIILRFVDP